MPDELTAAELALGTVQWGMPYGIANRKGRPELSEVQRILDKAQVAGITILDTARAYGASEEVIGQLVGNDPTWRIFTKLHPQADSAEATMTSLNASRTALGRSVLDGVLLHRAQQRQVHGGLVWDVLRRERDQQRIGALGISANTPEEAWAALDDSEIGWIQVACNLLDQRLYRTRFFERARGAGKRIVIRSVFLQGVAFLNADELPEHLASLRETLISLDEWANDHGVNRSCAFLAFAAELSGVRILVGCESAYQLERNLANWQDACRIVEFVRSLADQISPFPNEILTPSLWPQTAPLISEGPAL